MPVERVEQSVLVCTHNGWDDGTPPLVVTTLHGVISFKGCADCLPGTTIVFTGRDDSSVGIDIVKSGRHDGG